MSPVAHSEDPSTKVTGAVTITKITKVNQGSWAAVVNNEVAAVHVTVKKDLGTLQFSKSCLIEIVLGNLCRPIG